VVRPCHDGATSGRNEQFRCIITYQVAEEASARAPALRCQGDNRNFDAVTRLDIDEDKVTGVWADNVYSISGTLYGKRTDKGFIVQLRAPNFDARMSVVSSDCQQTVRVSQRQQRGHEGARRHLQEVLRALISLPRC